MAARTMISQDGTALDLRPSRDSEVRAAIDNRVYSGTAFAHQEIIMASADIEVQTRVLLAAMNTLTDNFEAKRPAEIKLACDNIAVVAADIERRGRQVAALSRSVSHTFAIHLSRRPRT